MGDEFLSPVEDKAGKDCEDCGKTLLSWQRRVRCKRCQKLVCSWCFHHGHNLVPEIKQDG